MGRGYDAIAGQLPHMELVHSQHAIDFLQKPLLDGINLDVRGHRLQQDQGGLAQQRPHGVQDQHNQYNGQSGIHIESVLPLRLPHHHSTDHHNDAAECIAQNVQEGAAHVHLAGIVAVSMAGLLHRRLLLLLLVGKFVLLILALVHVGQLCEAAVVAGESGAM